MPIVLPRSAQIFQKPSSHLKILDTKIVICSKLHYLHYPQILDASKQTFLATVTWCLEFLESYRQNSNVSNNRIMSVCGSVFSDAFTLTFFIYPMTRMSCK